jgi:hypothetical protein
MAERLLARPQTALPMPARLTPELVVAPREQRPAGGVRPARETTWTSYAGDEGGIVCRLDFGSKAGSAAYASNTHMRCDPRLRSARVITAYQMHRVKRLRREPP